MYEAKVTGEVSTSVSGCNRTEFEADTQAQASMCEGIVSSSNMGDGYDLECSITGVEDASENRRRLQNSTLSMRVNLELIISFLTTTELGQDPDRDQIASSTFNNLLTGLETAVTNGQLESFLRNTGIEIFSNITVDSIVSGVFGAQLVDQTPTKSPSKAPDDNDGDDDEGAAILSPGAIAGIAVGGFIVCGFLGAVLYLISRQSQSNQPTTKKISAKKVVPIATENVEFFDLEKVPRSPDIIGSDAVGEVREMWRDEPGRETEDTPAAAPTTLVADDIAAYMRRLQQQKSDFSAADDSPPIDGRVRLPHMDIPRDMQDEVQSSRIQQHGGHSAT